MWMVVLSLGSGKMTGSKCRKSLLVIEYEWWVFSCVAHQTFGMHQVCDSGLLSREVTSMETNFLLRWWKKLKRWFLYFLRLSPSLERKERENSRIHPHDTTALKSWLSYCLFVGFCGRTLLWRGWWCASLCPRLTFVESYSLSLLWSALGSVRSRPFMAILSQGVRPALTRTCEGQLTGDFWLPYRVF